MLVELLIPALQRILRPLSGAVKARCCAVAPSGVLAAGTVAESLSPTLGDAASDNPNGIRGLPPQLAESAHQLPESRHIEERKVVVPAEEEREPNVKLLERMRTPGVSPRTNERYPGPRVPTATSVHSSSPSSPGRQPHQLASLATFHRASAGGEHCVVECRQSGGDRGGLMLLGVAVQVWRRRSNGVGGRRED